LSAGAIIQIRLKDDNTPIKGSFVIELKTDSTSPGTHITSNRPNFHVTYGLNTNDEIKIECRDNTIPANTYINLIFRVKLTASEDSISPTISIWNDAT
jgi:hypothetical protein